MNEKQTQFSERLNALLSDASEADITLLISCCVDRAVSASYCGDQLNMTIALASLLSKMPERLGDDAYGSAKTFREVHPTFPRSLNLIRPLVGLDFEGTGTDSQTAQICQYAFVKVMPDGSRTHLTGLIKPTIPMPADAQAVHGISDEMLHDAPAFREKAREILDFIAGCDLAGYNLCAYDVPLLYFEFERVGISWDHLQHHIIDAGNIFKIRETRTLSAAMLFYVGAAHEDAHDALGDVYATLDVLNGQLAKYEDLPEDVAELALISNYGRKRADAGGKFVVNEAGEYVLNFGQHRGQLAKDNINYMYWILDKNFPNDVHKICREVIDIDIAVQQAKRASEKTTDDLPF